MGIVEKGVTEACCSKPATALARAGVTVDAPASVEAAAEYIRQQLQAGVRAENRIGVVLVWMLEMSGKKVSQFISDARQAFTVSERQLYTYLAGGRLLLSDDFASQPDDLKKRMICGADKLALVTPIAEKGAGTLRMFLEHNDPRAMTRDELGLKVDLYLTKLLTEAERAKEKTKADRKASERGANEIRKALKPLGNVPDDELPAAVRRVGASRVFDQGLRLLCAAVDSQVEGAETVDPEAVAQWKEQLTAALAEVQKISGAV